MSKLNLWMTRREQGFVLFVLAILLLGGIVHAIRNGHPMPIQPTETGEQVGK